VPPSVLAVTLSVLSIMPVFWLYHSVFLL
jgi:hypothetical protein